MSLIWNPFWITIAGDFSEMTNIPDKNHLTGPFECSHPTPILHRVVGFLCIPSPGVSHASARRTEVLHQCCARQKLVKQEKVGEAD